MKQEEYRNTDDYRKAKENVKCFVNEFLQGDLLALNGFDLECLKYKDNGKKFIGKINDPDMYVITQSIYILVWGHIFNLKYSNMGSWGKTKDTRYSYRGDTMNSFNSVYGKDCIIAKRYLDENDKLFEDIYEYRKLYHSIGNFIVIPNRGNINSIRADYHSLQDYFDYFLYALYCYQNQIEYGEYSDFGKKMKDGFDCNKEYNSISFPDWVRLFFLESYIENGKPKNVFLIDKSIRMKEYIGRNIRSKEIYYSKDEYEKLIKNYYSTAKEIISCRGSKICAVLKEEIG